MAIEIMGEFEEDNFRTSAWYVRNTQLEFLKKKQIPTPIVTSNAELTMKKTAELRNDKSKIAAIANESLITKEFKKHYQCYRDYTCLVSMNNT